MANRCVRTSEIQQTKPWTVLSWVERILGVCLGIMPYFVLIFCVSYSHTQEWKVLQVSLHAGNQNQVAAATISETKPQQSSGVSV